MKYKYLCTASAAAILTALFLPIFLCVIFIGNHMPYNAKHKITTFCPNYVLLVCAVLAAVCVIALLYFLRKIPFNRYTAAGAVVFTLLACIALYAVNEKISKCIAFYGGWDCGMVANSARWLYEGGEMGYGNYYKIFTNNVPITWLLYRLYCLSNAIPDYPYNPEFIWIQFQCVMFSAAVFFSVMTALIVSRKIAPAVLTLIMGILFLGLSPWKIIPYTDASTVAMPAVTVFLYALSLLFKSGPKYIFWLLMAFTGILGGIFKASCYVILIAIVLIDLIWLFFKEASPAQKAGGFVLRAALILAGFLLASFLKDEMYQALHYQYDADAAISWTSFLYDGLNEDSTGACSDDGYKIAEEYIGRPRHLRDMAERKAIRDRLAEKGVVGLLIFWLRKSVMNFNDGTFSWFQEGFFNAWQYEDIIDSSLEKPLQSFYWQGGANYLWFTTISQGLWIFILLGILAETALLLRDSTKALKNNTPPQSLSLEFRMRTVLIVAFIGLFLFVMLFEGRSRYLFNSACIFILIAVMGYYKLTDRLADYLRNRKSKGESPQPTSYPNAHPAAEREFQSQPRPASACSSL